MTETFAALIERGANGGEIAAHLDRLDEAHRIREVRGCPAASMRALWDRVKGLGSVDVASFVSVSDRTVVYAGLNSLPLLRTFEKRFFRAGALPTAIGYNQQAMSVFTGPGYFTTKNADDGEIAFDYTELPKDPPADWPPVRPNTGIFAGAVYGGMIDYCRRVSRDTVLGKAYKQGKERGAFFLLTRSEGGA